jgi:hypothetical protein
MCAAAPSDDVVDADADDADDAVNADDSDS